MNPNEMFNQWLKIFCDKNIWTEYSKSKIDYNKGFTIQDLIKQSYFNKMPIPPIVIEELKKSPSYMLIISTFNIKFDIKIDIDNDYQSDIDRLLLMLIILTNGEINKINVMLFGIVGRLYTYYYHKSKFKKLDKSPYELVKEFNIKHIVNLIPFMQNKYITDENFQMLYDKRLSPICNEIVDLFTIPYKQLLNIGE